MTTLVTEIKIQQGATFNRTWNWYGGGKICREVTSIDTGCPTTLTTAAHLLPTGDTPVYLEARGARELDTKGKEVLATYVSATEFSVPINTLGKTYSSPSVVMSYYAPKGLTGYIARMSIRENIDDTTAILELTSAGGDITITLANAAVTVTISATVTATLDFEEAFFDLELEDTGGVVTRLVEGKVLLSDEVTR